MKHLLITAAVTCLGISSAVAGFSERKLESAKTSAARSGKKIAFVFYQDYYLPNCPRCIATVNENNAAIKKAVPRSEVVMVEIEKGDKDMDKLPACVAKDGPLPRIVVTDGETAKVVAELKGAPDRDKAKAFEAQVKAESAE
jgi:hypothetical protein